MNNIGHKIAYELSLILSEDTQSMLVTAESCTGGMVASACTDIIGSSRWFWGGFVTYANQAKHLLGVDELIIERYGAVSEPVAASMASAAALQAGVNLAIAVTGIAGPDGGSEDKPAGTVCFGWYRDSTVVTAKKLFAGNRQQIRQAATEYALEHCIELLKEQVLNKAVD